MWKLRIGAEARQDPHLFTTNNFAGRQIWEFDANGGSPEELAEVEEARLNFSNNKSRFKASPDLLWRRQVGETSLHLNKTLFSKYIIISLFFCLTVSEGEKVRAEDPESENRGCREDNI